MRDTPSGPSNPSDRLDPIDSQQTGEPYLFLTLDGNEPTEPVSRHRLGGTDIVHIGRGVERIVHRDTENGQRCLYLRFPDPWMSSQHVRIERSAKGASITDPGSKNGSFVNGTRLQSAVLQDGDILQFGHTFFVYRAELPVEPGEDDDTVADMNAPLGLSTILSPLSHSFVRFVRAAASDISMVLEGEVGTGKSILARSAHALSGAEGRFVTLNVGDLNDELLERKLRGATTDGSRGAFNEATGGTLVIEDIDTLSLRSQTTLSSALDAGPLGCRIISTSTRHLADMVKVGKFDEALANKLSGHRLSLPPLCHRREDIGLLIANMIKRYAPVEKVVFSADAAYALLCYTWPRNLRELESCIGTALAWRSSSLIDVSHLPPELRKPMDRDNQASGDTIDTVELVQQDLEKRANMIASLRARSGHVFNNRDSLEQVRSQFKSWLARTDIKYNKID